MSDLAKSITSVCHNLINKPDNLRTKTNKQYHKELERIMEDPNSNQWLVLSTSDSDFYVNIGKNISVTLFKELNTDTVFNEINSELLETLKQTMQIIDEDGWYHVAMKEWEIEINFNNSAISDKISEHKYIQKTGALIKGEDCFIQKCTPWWRDGERYYLITATQEDLTEILKWLTNLL